MEYDSERSMVSRLIRMFGRRDRDLDCNDVREHSSNYIDEELADETAKKIREHISWCGPCNSFINTLVATVGLLRSTPKEEPPSDFKDRIRKHLQQNSPR